jgi:hypothetical protein
LGISIDFEVGISIGFEVGISIDFEVGISIDFEVGISIGFEVGISIDFEVGISIDFEVGISIDFEVGISIDFEVGISIDFKVNIPEIMTSIMNNLLLFSYPSLPNNSHAIIDDTNDKNVVITLITVINIGFCKKLSLVTYVSIIKDIPKAPIHMTIKEMSNLKNILSSLSFSFSSIVLTFSF